MAKTIETGNEERGGRLRQYKQNRSFKSLGIIYIVALIVILAVVVCFMKKQQKDMTSTDNKDTAVEKQKDEEAKPTPSAIYQSGDIEIYSLFPSSVINTDGGSEYVENLASIEFKNISGAYLTLCRIEIRDTDGETYTFVAEDVSKDMKVMAFEINNKTWDEEKDIESITSTAKTMAEEMLLEEIESNVDGMTITIKNKSDRDLFHVTVVCHCMMDDTSYGGRKYNYLVDKLPAGQTATIEAVDCYFGEAKVVCVLEDE